MATSTFNMAFNNTSDATYRTWVTQVVNALDSMPGWTRAGDTGQINLGTAVRTTNTLINYIMLVSNDGGTPIYLRVDFVNVNGVGLPSVAVQVGYATDGAGAITGTQNTARFVQGNTAASDTTARVCLVSGAAGRLAVALNLNAVTLPNSVCFSVERSRDASGAATNDGVLVMYAFGSTTTSFQYIPATGGTPTLESRLPAILTTGASTAFGTTISLSPVIPLAGSAQNPGINLLVHHVNDFTRDTQHSLSLYGTNRNYYILGPNWAASHLSANGRIAMLYE